MGEDGVTGLGSEARSAIESAELVFGGQRHLELARSLIRGAAQSWTSPFCRALDRVLEQRGRTVCVLASGDPLLHGVGSTLLKRLPLAELRILPAVSSFSLAAARLGWDLAQTARLALHASPLHQIRRELQPGARILALCSGAETPAALADLLERAGFGESQLSLLEALGGPRERVRSSTARAFAAAAKDIDPLYLLGIEVHAGERARVLPLAPGLPDAWYEHDGQLTRREARALALSALAPRRGERLWDVGAGSGSIAIEWLLCDPSLCAIAIESHRERAERIRRNAEKLGAPALEVREGRAPGALAGLPAPQAVFVGGGGSDPALLDAAIGALPSGGRLVVHAVTLETERELIARHAALGGELARLELSRVTPLGSMRGWESARPITQWRWSPA